ncbi:MAG: AAA family ATPase [Candidatus Hodarchaeota archaeon]
MELLLKNLLKLKDNGVKSLNDLENLFGFLDRKRKRSRKFGDKHIFSISRNRFAISRNTIKKHQMKNGNQFFIIVLDWAEPSRLFCIPFWEFAEEIEQKARVGYGTASYNQNSYIFGFNLDNTCTWGGLRLDTSKYAIPHNHKILVELGLTKEPLVQTITELTVKPDLNHGYLLDLKASEYRIQVEDFLAGTGVLMFEIRTDLELEEEGFILLAVKERSEIFVGSYESSPTDQGLKMEFLSLTSTKLDRSSLNTWNQKISGSLINFNADNMIKFVSREIFDELIEKYGAENIGIQKELDWQNIDLGDLKYNDEESLKRNISAILNSGHNMIITGPPGVGKTVLAEKIGEAAQRTGLCTGLLTITGTSDWSSFETIGGLMPIESENSENFALRFVEGIFLQAIRENRWLIIDEINRCDIDKVFGPFFTVFSNNRVELPYKKDDKPIIISPNFSNENSSYDKDNCTYEIGKNWRIIGTMNEADKSSLFDLSFAFMRRFAFLNIPNPRSEIVTEILSRGIEEKDGDKALQAIVKLSNLNSREIGISILISILGYMKHRGYSIDSFKEAINAFIYP